MKKYILITLIAILVTGIGIGVIETLEYKLELKNKISENTEKLDSVSELTLGSTLPIAGATYTLAGSGITSSGSSITLQSFTIPQNDYEIQDSDLSSTFYITLEPGSTKRQEIVSCTTVVQNANDTATLSGCTRGLSPITPFTASTSLRFAHAGGTQVIFSDPPQLFNEYVSLANAETISGKKLFDVFPEFSDGTSPTTTNQFATKGYADNLVNQGAATSSETVAGISELATRVENASSTVWGILDPHVQQSQHASSTPSDNAFTDGVVWDIWSENDGKLSQLWLDLTEAFTWTGTHSFSGNNTHSGTETFSATSTFSNLIADGFVQAYTALEGISAMDAVISTSTATTTSQMVAVADASIASTTYSFIGFALTSAEGGETVYVQTSGEVSGFTGGLTTTTLYFISDTAGEISDSSGTVEGIVGLATDYDTINLNTRSNYGMQYVGSMSITTSATTIVPYTAARFAIIKVVVSGTGCSSAGDIMIARVGKTSGSIKEGAPTSNTCSGSYTWVAGGITNTVAASESPTQTATAYFYR